MRYRSIPAIFLLLFGLVTLGPASVSWAQEDQPPAETSGETDSEASADDVAEEADADPPAMDLGEATDASEEGDASEAESADAPAAGGPPPWMKSIDDFFGDYVVSPVSSVIFFDFYTGPYTEEVPAVDEATGEPILDENGEQKMGTIQHSGWLGTSIPFVVIWLLAGGTFLTFKMGFINFRAFGHAIRLTKGDYDDPDEPGEVSHFQALAAALSATVGLGNIAGVALAIGLGGPGATAWIVLIGLLGMTAKFTECTLGQLYRVQDEDGHVLGGPMRYLRHGLEDMGFPMLGKILAVIFMILCIGASFGGGNSFQVGQSLEAIRGDIPLLQSQPWIYGLVMAVAVGVVIVGGIKSIGAVAGKIVPFMCFAYLAACLYILAVNFSAVPAAFGTIISEAMQPQAMYGGFLGVLVIGVKRAVFSNEAGVGSAAIAHSAAKTDEPVSEGIVALLEPFIDTVLVCTITSLVVIVTGAYQAPEVANAIAAEEGAPITLYAFTNGGHGWFRYILYTAVVLFAYSTCISWSYYGERCWAQLFGPSTSIVYKLLFLVFTFLGSVITRGNILAFSDLMILGMSLPNLLGVFLLSGLVKRKLDDYWQRLRSGDIKTHAESVKRGEHHKHAPMPVDHDHDPE